MLSLSLILTLFSNSDLYIDIYVLITEVYQSIPPPVRNRKYVKLYESFNIIFIAQCTLQYLFQGRVTSFFWGGG